MPAKFKMRFLKNGKAHFNDVMQMNLFQERHIGFGKLEIDGFQIFFKMF
jgi:hypothetical protein